MTVERIPETAETRAARARVPRSYRLSEAGELVELKDGLLRVADYVAVTHVVDHLHQNKKTERWMASTQCKVEMIR